jgi:hypothetical protein
LVELFRKKKSHLMCFGDFEKKIKVIIEIQDQIKELKKSFTTINNLQKFILKFFILKSLKLTMNG